MHGQMRKRMATLAGVACSVGLCAGVACAQTQTPMPVDRTETWSEPGTAGWTNASAAASVSNPGGYLLFRHAAQAIPAYAKDTVRVALEPGVRVTNVALTVTIFEHAPSALRLEFRAVKSGRRWYTMLDRPEAGESKQYVVPVAFGDGGWKIGPNSSEVAFEEDVPLVDWIGVAVTRSADVAAQDYGIDDFRLQGVYVDDLDADGMPNAWELTYGFDPASAADAGADPDGDRMSNYGEYRAGTRPDDAGSALRVGIDVTNRADGGKAVVLSWPSASARTYEVLSTESPAEGFGSLAAGVPATAGTNVYEDVAGDGRLRVYRVRVETE